MGDVQPGGFIKPRSHGNSFYEEAKKHQEETMKIMVFADGFEGHQRRSLERAKN